MPSGRAELATGAAGPIPELRHVAVLFADLQGFTRLCERLDPEEVVDILQAIFERLQEVIPWGQWTRSRRRGDGAGALRLTRTLPAGGDGRLAMQWRYCPAAPIRTSDQSIGSGWG